MAIRQDHDGRPELHAPRDAREPRERDEGIVEWRGIARDDVGRHRDVVRDHHEVVPQRLRELSGPGSPPPVRRRPPLPTPAGARYTPTTPRIRPPGGVREPGGFREEDYEYAGPSGGRLSNFKNELKGCGPFLHDDPRDRPAEIFGGTVTLHTGPDRAAYLLIPVIPPKEGTA